MAEHIHMHQIQVTEFQLFFGLNILRCIREIIKRFYYAKLLLSSLISAVTGRDDRSLDMLDNRCQGYDAAVATAATYRTTMATLVKCKMRVTCISRCSRATGTHFDECLLPYKKFLINI
jgi:hypothetical protein